MTSANYFIYFDIPSRKKVRLRGLQREVFVNFVDFDREFAESSGLQSLRRGSEGIRVGIHL